MSDIEFKEVPEDFVLPNEEELPPVLPSRQIAANEETHYAEETELDEMAEEVTQRNPGLVTGIFSIVLSIITFMFIVGLPLSIVSISKSRKAKKSSAVGIVGFVLNLLSLIATAFIVVVLLGLVDGLNEVCQTITGGGTLALPDGTSYTCPM